MLLSLIVFYFILAYLEVSVNDKKKESYAPRVLNVAVLNLVFAKKSHW